MLIIRTEICEIIAHCTHIWVDKKRRWDRACVSSVSLSLMQLSGCFRSNTFFTITNETMLPFRTHFHRESIISENNEKTATINWKDRKRIYFNPHPGSRHYQMSNRNAIGRLNWSSKVMILCYRFNGSFRPSSDTRKSVTSNYNLFASSTRRRSHSLGFYNQSLLDVCVICTEDRLLA